MSHQRCPNCGQDLFARLAQPREIQRESYLREQFVLERAPHSLSPAEQKDLTNFAHNPAAAILVCERCGVLVRDELDADYANDQYDWNVMERLFPRYVQAFRDKEPHYRKLLPASARVLEVGSHLGAFLQVAKEWGWEAIGVDIGKDTAGFATAKGLNVCREELDIAGFAGDSFDGVFVWNCFEQIPDEAALLKETRRILKDGGLLVVRVPNASFYERYRKSLCDEGGDLALKALAYNNLLGFPYLYGFSGATLNEMVERFGFITEGLVNSELITFPLPDEPNRVKEERQDTSAAVMSQGPWLELAYRKSTAPGSE